MARQWSGTGEANLASRRTAQRLSQDLGVNAEGVEVILLLREQVMTLQARVRELEGELRRDSKQRNARFTPYRDVYYEASWVETGEDK